MGLTSNRLWSNLVPVFVTFNLILIASIVIAMTAYWFSVQFNVGSADWVPTGVPTANVGPFSCNRPGQWYAFAYNGFCSKQKLDEGSRGDSNNLNCLPWRSEDKWGRMDSFNFNGAQFIFSKDNWQTIAALLALALVISVVTTIMTCTPGWYTFKMLGIASFLYMVMFNALFAAWIMGEASDMMNENMWDGMSGCGNAYMYRGPGYGFAVGASGIALLLLLMSLGACAARGFEMFDAMLSGPGYAKEGVGRVEEKYDATQGEQRAAPARAGDQEVRGYRPDIVA